MLQGGRCPTARTSFKSARKGNRFWHALAVISLFLVGGAAAQVPGQTEARCQNTDKLEATHFRATQISGLALVELGQPDSLGRTVEIDYRGESFVGKFDQDGRVRIGFVLTEASAEFAIRLAETPLVTCKVDVPDFAKIFRVILRWQDPVQLDLNVIEPGRKMTRRNIDAAQRIGHVDLVGAAPAEGATAEASYLVPDGTIIPASSEFGFRVDFVTRGRKPEAPYCGDHPLAVAQMELIVIEKGQVTTRRLRTNRIACGANIAESRRYMAIR